MCCFWSLCSASPQALILQLPFPILSPMNFSVDSFHSPAQLLLSGLSLLHPDLRKEKLILSSHIWCHRNLARCEVWDMYKLDHTDKLSLKTINTRKPNHNQCFQINLFWFQHQPLHSVISPYILPLSLRL